MKRADAVANTNDSNSVKNDWVGNLLFYLMCGAGGALTGTLVGLLVASFSDETVRGHHGSTVTNEGREIVIYSLAAGAVLFLLVGLLGRYLHRNPNADNAVRNFFSFNRQSQLSDGDSKSKLTNDAS